MASIQHPERGLWAYADIEGAAVEVGSLHVTNAAHGKSRIKREHYVALGDWLRRPAPARIVGMDANHTFDPHWPDLPGEVYGPRADDWAEEYAFSARTPSTACATPGWSTCPHVLPCCNRRDQAGGAVCVLL